jgi:hypothetical protein
MLLRDKTTVPLKTTSDKFRKHTSSHMHTWYIDSSNLYQDETVLGKQFRNICGINQSPYPAIFVERLSPQFRRQRCGADPEEAAVQSWRTTGAEWGTLGQQRFGLEGGFRLVGERRKKPSTSIGPRPDLTNPSPRPYPMTQTEPIGEPDPSRTETGKATPFGTWNLDATTYSISSATKFFLKFLQQKFVLYYYCTIAAFQSAVD